MFVDLLLGFLCAMSFLPLTTGYCAHSYGRSFWLWFALGWVLPIVSFFLLFALICRKQLNPGECLLDEAKAILADAEQKAINK
ncbi:hypothetical protein GCM10011375_30030 [Hymenobacter qilianensis]|uniref:Uncharacterized protein n=1 Tax=Hymenobacter qilianensis TaxID=1385715 RepID=A0ACB5PUC8_9BACT|nr:MULTISPECIES: hypothetical protein [Hymenobacter]MBC6605960.1 hypothetical protein [Hymenobacter sp. BT188]GGF72899.1 hypothetical protein GCM10011375_30030 [Hymenobacter qilianensis]